MEARSANTVKIFLHNRNLYYFRVCLARSANIPVQNEPLQHPCEHTPLIGRYLEKLYKDQPEILNNYLDMILLLSHSSAGKKL